MKKYEKSVTASHYVMAHLLTDCDADVVVSRFFSKLLLARLSILSFGIHQTYVGPVECLYNSNHS